MKIKEVNYTYLPTRLSTEYLLSQKWQSLLMALCRAIEYNIPIIFFLQIWKYSLDPYLLKLFLCIFLSVCVSVCVHHMLRSPWKSEEGARFWGPEVTLNCESPRGFLKPHSNPLQKQQMLLLELYFKLILTSWIVLYGPFRRLHTNSKIHKHSDLILGVMSY